MALTVSPTPTTTDQLAGSKQFTNPDYVLADDTDRATYDSGNPGLTSVLFVSGFGTDATLPGDAYITGITVTVKAHKSNGLPAPTITFNKVSVSVDDTEGDDLSDDEGLTTTADTEFTFGGDTELWGFTSTELADLVTNDSLKVNLQFNVSSGGGTNGYVRYVGVEIAYRRFAGEPISTQFIGSQYKHSGMAQLTKKTTEDLPVSSPVSAASLPPETIDVPPGADRLLFNMVSDSGATFQYADVWGYYQTAGNCYIPVLLVDQATVASPISTGLGADMADLYDDVTSTDEPYSLMVLVNDSINTSVAVGGNTNGAAVLSVALKGAAKVYINPNNTTTTYSYTFGTFTKGEGKPSKR